MVQCWVLCSLACISQLPDVPPLDGLKLFPNAFTVIVFVVVATNPLPCPN